MAFSLERFVEVRAYMYHLTAASNLARIRSLKCLESAKVLLERADQPELLHQRRPANLVITIDGLLVSLRDQSPLHEGNIDFEDGWTFRRVVALLNQRVFFWPGWERGPIDYGLRHYERHKAERPAVLRVRTASLLRANEGNPPLFCRFNSGSPRCCGGLRSPRGSETFLEAKLCKFVPSEVVEVAFVGAAYLPEDIEVRGGSWTKWDRLFVPAAVPMA